MALLTAKLRGWTWLRESQCSSPDLPPKVFWLANCKLSTWRDVPQLLNFLLKTVLAKALEAAGTHDPVTQMALGPTGYPIPRIPGRDALAAARFAQRMLREKADTRGNVLARAYEKPSTLSRQAYTNLLGQLASSCAALRYAGISPDWAPWVPAKERAIYGKPKPGVYDVEVQHLDAHRSYPPGAHVRIWYPLVSPKPRLLCAYQQFEGGRPVYSWIMEGVYWTLPFLELLEFVAELISGRHDLFTETGRTISRIGKCRNCGMFFVRRDARQQHCSPPCADAARYRRGTQQEDGPSC